MPKINPPDQAARRKIEEELETNFLVEAGAGSGKTTSLIRRMVSLLKSGTITVGQMAAITFTRKAAGELRERFQTALEKAYREEKELSIKQRLQQALMDIDQCFLGTIHSYCANLLRERPVEAGLDPAFEELDALDETVLQDSAWESYLLEVKLTSPERLNRLEEIGASLHDLKSSFVALSQYQDVNLIYTETPKPDLAPGLEGLKLLVERALQALPDDEPDKGWDDLQGAILKAGRFFKFFDLNRETNVVNLLKSFAKHFAVTQNRWQSKEEAKQFRDEFNALAEEILEPLLQAWREYCHPILMEFIIPALKYYEQIRFKHSTLNFQDLLIKTRDMLKNNSEVRTYFQAKYRRLLVDEFQDTDPIQAEILFYLTGQDLEEKDWHKLVPFPGSLFVVGDPKQSIYRFRRADIDIYNLTKKLVEKSGGEVLKLTANFRSVQVFGEWLNPIFQGIFPDYESAYQAEFSPLQTLRPTTTATAFGVKVLNIPSEFAQKEAVFTADADSIARYIRSALDGDLSLAHMDGKIGDEVIRKPEPQDFMILLRFKDGMDIYARALEDYGIPVSITGGSSISSSVEIAEFYKLLRVLSDPGDQVLLVGVLRGLFFGLSDDELYQVKKAGGYLNLYGTVPEGLTEDIAGKYGNALAKLKEYLHWTRQKLPTVAVAHIIADLGLIPYALGLNQSQSRTAYFYQVLELLRQAEASGKTRFDQIVAEFGLLMSASLEDELSLTAREENAVRLMNLHKAKGLEAPVVFLAQPFKEVSQRADVHIRRQGKEPEGYCIFTSKRGYQSQCIAQPVRWSDYEDEELRYLEAEESRLVYVAATRSKNMLVVSRSLKDDELRKNPWALLIQDAVNQSETEEQTELYLTVPDIPDDNEYGTTPATVKATDKGHGPKILHEFLAVREQLSSWAKELAKPTYRTESPTGLKEHSLNPQIKRETGGGLAWGRVIHKTFEELVKGTEDLDTVIELTLEENGIPLERKEEVITTVHAFCKTDLWQRITVSAAKYTEVPFSLPIEQGHTLFKYAKGDDNLPILLSGVIDLVFKENNGWVIVDYKTDRVQEENDLDLLLEYYSPQVIMYGEVWRELTGEDYKSGEIYFVEKQVTKQIF